MKCNCSVYLTFLLRYPCFLVILTLVFILLEKYLKITHNTCWHINTRPPIGFTPSECLISCKMCSDKISLKLGMNHTIIFLGCTGLFKCELEKILLSSAFKHTPKAKYFGLHQMKKLWKTHISASFEADICFFVRVFLIKNHQFLEPQLSQLFPNSSLRFS